MAALQWHQTFRLYWNYSDYSNRGIIKPKVGGGKLAFKFSKESHSASFIPLRFASKSKINVEGSIIRSSCGSVLKTPLQVVRRTLRGVNL